MDEHALRTKYRPGIPCWVDTSQPDVDAALAFYGELFDWTFDERPVPGPGRYVVASRNGEVVGGIGTPAPGDDGGARWTTFVAVEDADAAVERIVVGGGTVRTPPEDAGPAGRSALCLDPQGAEIGVWQQGRRIGAERVNQDGSWNWSDLVTTEPDGAARFYGAVFGWRVLEAGVGPNLAHMWTAPGYGDALAELDPTLRDRHASPGVPEGFSDAIGWLEGSGDGTASWRVTFAVADPDKVAEVAQRLGARVLAEPHDAGPVRLATVADPAGATFVVSRYQPD